MINASFFCLLSLIGAFNQNEHPAVPEMVSAYEVVRVFHNFQCEQPKSTWVQYAARRFHSNCHLSEIELNSSQKFSFDKTAIDSLNKVEASQKIPVFIPIALVLSPAAGFIAWRTIQAKNRAYEMTKQYFEYKNSNGMIGDAYRHVLVSLLLRKYLNRPVAHHIMWAWEKKADIQKSNEARNKYMDLHNNRIGRFLEFKTLKQGKTYQDWALNTKYWIETKTNGAYWPWHKNAPSKQDAKLADKSTPKNQYIYWR